MARPAGVGRAPRRGALGTPQGCSAGGSVHQSMHRSPQNFQKVNLSSASHARRHRGHPLLIFEKINHKFLSHRLSENALAALLHIAPLYLHLCNPRCVTSMVPPCYTTLETSAISQNSPRYGLASTQGPRGVKKEEQGGACTLEAGSRTLLLVLYYSQYRS